MFVAHGSPALALEDTKYTRFLHRLGKSLPTPSAIAIFSAHWDDAEQLFTTRDDLNEGSLKTLHDFYGFPEALYQIKYPAADAPVVEESIGSLFRLGNLPYRKVSNRGLDHGAWIVLRAMYPEGNIPVIELSIDSKRSPAEQYQIGQMLQSLREQNVLILGSGGTVHNLRKLEQGSEPASWATEFDTWIAEQLASWRLPSLYHYEKNAPHALSAVPTYAQEHLAPLFYAMGTADEERKAYRLFQDYAYSSLSLSCWQFGGEPIYLPED
nr:class III extradiol ring-cleavage dioxygenase [Paenibacillus shirakamiensis]